MRDQLKNYIDDHRTELDKAVPSDKLWSNIENAMTVALPATGVSSSVSWLKYFAFGLSSVAGAAIIYLAASSSTANAEHSNAVVTTQPTVEATVKAPEQINSATVTPTGFLVMNTTVLSPESNETPEANAFSLMVPPTDTLSLETLNAKTAVPVNVGDTLFTGIKRVEVISTSARVNVKSTVGNSVDVSLANPVDTSVNVEYKRIDTTLQVTVTVKCDKPITRVKKRVIITERNTPTPELNVNIPSGTSIVVQNTYGDTKITGINAPVCEVRSSSGDVQVASVIASTTIASSYGDVDAQDITGNLNARLNSGDAVVERVTGNVDVASTYGDQVHKDITGNLKANGSSGNINITNLRGDVNANTTYGYIQISDFKGSAKLVSSSGSILGDKIELTANSTFVTTYGDVNVTLVNPMQDLSFDLATTYGDILIDKNGEVLRNESHLNVTRGKILVKATSSSGDQVFR